MGKSTISMAVFKFAFCMFTRPGISMVPEELHTEDNSVASALPRPTGPRRRPPACSPATAPHRYRWRRARRCRSLKRWRWPWLLLWQSGKGHPRHQEMCIFSKRGLNIWTCAFQKHSLFWALRNDEKCATVKLHDLDWLGIYIYVYIYMMHMICIMYGRSYHSGNPFEGSMGP